VEVTSSLRALEWSSAAVLLADLLALDLDQDQPYRLEIGEATIIDVEAEVTYSSPVALHADRARIDAPVHTTDGASDA
jgi:hypothetical protein